MKGIWTTILISVIYNLAQPERASAFPQFVKDGYFACSSCHVGTGGGDALTPYGRGFAVEKLAMWAEEGEGSPTFGASAIPSWLLIGGHVRWIQVKADTSTQRYADNFWMQRDLDLGISTEVFTTYATLSPLPLSKAVTGDESSFGVRKWLMRGQVTENLSASLGVFYPKYGLMLADHNAFIREKLGFGAGAEQEVLEIAWNSEAFEIALTTELPMLPDLPQVDPPGGAVGQSHYVTAAYFAGEKHRLGVNFSVQNDDNERVAAYGPHATLALSKALSLSTEVDWVKRNAQDQASTSLLSYADLTAEVTKGLWLQLVHESHLANLSDLRSRLEKQSVRVQVFPRPHWDLKLTVGQTKNYRDYSFTNYGSLIIHFWL